MAKAGFNNDGNYTPEIKDKAIHVKKVPTPGIDVLGGPAAEATDGNMTPGDGSKYAPKSNRTDAPYKDGGSHTGDRR